MPVSLSPRQAVGGPPPTPETLRPQMLRNGPALDSRPQAAADEGLMGAGLRGRCGASCHPPEAGRLDVHSALGSCPDPQGEPPNTAQPLTGKASHGAAGFYGARTVCTSVQPAPGSLGSRRTRGSRPPLLPNIPTHEPHTWSAGVGAQPGQPGAPSPSTPGARFGAGLPSGSPLAWWPRTRG